MFDGSPVFVRFQRFGSEMTSGASWWLLVVPGLILITLALAILVWPELLAYMVASALLFVGLLLSLWGWRIRRAEMRMRRQVQRGPYRIVS